jgi:uncharacterized membrane protein
MVLVALLVVVLVFLFVGVTEAVFEKIGFSRTEFAIILFVTFIGSFVNIPLRNITSVEPMVGFEEVRIFWVTYRIPQMFRRRITTLVTINLGGAVVPILVSAYLLLSHFSLLADMVVATAVTSIVIHLMARRVKGVGIVTPALLPPIAAAVISILIHPASGAAVLAYVSGSMGALIGADLTNLRGITKLGAPVVSIGGAGTFDGVFLTGIIAALIVSLI